MFSTCCLFHNLLLGRKEVVWKSSCEWFKLKACKMFMHKILMDCIMVRKCSHLGPKALRGAKLSQLGNLSCCITLLTMYEVFNPTLLLAFFQFKKIGPMQMQVSFKYKNVWKFIHVLPMMQYLCLMSNWHVVGPL